MALATDVVTTSQLRNAVGVVGDTEDSILESYRDSAIEIIEKYVGRNIIDRQDWATDPDDFFYIVYPNRIGFRVADIRGSSFVLHYVNHDDDPTPKTNQELSFDLSDSRVYTDADHVEIYSDGENDWTEVLRLFYPSPRIVCDVGIKAVDIPAAWKTATELLVRGMYDGSAYDSFADNNVVMKVLKPWRIQAFMRSIRV